ncbi:MAG: hypothetical protein Q9217_002619 [Psora testacea]
MSSLQECLNKVLPKGCQFTLHHLSTPPSPSSAIFAPPPGQKPDETYCESQFLSISIHHNGHPLQVFAIEVLIYTTEYLTTLFVSKADSTGYLHFLDLPKGTPSPLKTISTSILHYLISERKRSDRRLVLSLFARAQNQYLFPASVENSHKHVLDDRGLIRWWCRVVDPVLGGDVAESEEAKEDRWPQTSAMGYLRVPGYDAYETKAFFPKCAIWRSTLPARWRVADPLQDLSLSPDLPERCLIPRFPDDPKARFVETLDDELLVELREDPQSQSRHGASRMTNNGRWRSIRSLDQFWDAMSFRQECSSGRLVGFLWAVFTPRDFLPLLQHSTQDLEASETPTATLPAPPDSQHQESVPLPIGSPLPSSPPHEPPVTPSPSSQTPQEPPTPTPVKIRESKAIEDQPEKTKCYYWPTSSRGEVVLRQKDYDRVGRFLLRQDYANKEVAVKSTRKWVNNVAERAGIKNWGKIVVGEKEVAIAAQATINGGSGANLLGAGLIRKKKRPADGDVLENPSVNGLADASTLSAGLVRKKSKAR